MRKLLSLIAALTLVFSLSACGEADPTPGAAASSAPAASPAASELPAPTPGGAASGSTLVAYFSWSGNTRSVAQLIADAVGAELFEIAPAEPYTEDYDELLDIARQEQRDGARPELAAQVEDWDSYDTIFLGYPNWWSDAPMAVYTFLESYDFGGKTLIPFNTSASSGFGRSLTGIEAAAAGATILDGLALTEGELSGAENSVNAWLEGLGLS